MDESPLKKKVALVYMVLGAVLAVVVLAVMAGSMAYADKPQFCGSCHSTQEVYATFNESTHRGITCGDCHLPQQNIVVKMTAKASNGMRHTYHETLRDYPEPILVSGSAKQVVNDNCLRCHSGSTANTHLSAGGDCTSCHRDLVHNERRLAEKKGGVGLE